MTKQAYRWPAWVAVVAVGFLLWAFLLNSSDPTAVKSTTGSMIGASESAPDNTTAAQPTKDPGLGSIISRLPLTDSSDDGAAKAATVDEFRTSVLVRTFTTEGIPLPGCCMVLKPARVDIWEVVDELQLTEGPEGEHRALGFHPGQYSLFYTQPLSLDPHRSQPLATAIWGPGHSETVDVKIADLADLVSGVVSLPSGEPVVGAFVHVASDGSRHIWSQTNENGRFLLLRATGDTSSSAELLLTDDLGEALIADAPTAATVQWGNLNSRLVAQPRAFVHVWLRDESGSPVPRFQVSLRSRAHLGRVTRNASGADGVAILHGVPRGAALLTILPEGCGIPIWQEISVAPDGSGTVHCTIRAGVHLRGTVRSSSGAPVAGAVATLELAEVADSSRAGSPVADRQEIQLAMPVAEAPAGKLGKRFVRCDVANGEFAFTVDPALSYRLRVEAPRHNVFEGKVEAVEREFPDIAVTLLPTSSLRTRLQPPEAAAWLATYRRQTGKREHGSFSMVATGRHRDAKPENQQLDPREDGVIYFENLSAGRWLLWLKGPARPQLVATVDLEPGQNLELPPIDLEHLRPGRLEIKVAVESAEMRPIRVACAVRGEKIEIPIQSDGSFRLEASGGSYLLRFAISTPAGLKTVMYANPVLVQAGAESREHIRLGMQKLQIQAIDNATGQPVPDLTISIDEERSTGTYKTIKTDAAGNASWDPGPCGDFGLSWLDQASNEWKSALRSNSSAEQPIVLRIVR